MLQTFTGAIPADVVMDPATVAPAEVARAYGLKSSHGVYVYMRDAQKLYQQAERGDPRRQP